MSLVGQTTLIERFAEVCSSEVKLDSLKKFFIDVRNNIAPKIGDKEIAELDHWIDKLSYSDSISDGDHTFYELYSHRHLLFITLMKSMADHSWRAMKHDDGTKFDGWFIAGINLEVAPMQRKAITYHMPDELWPLLDNSGCITYDKAPEWDGHDSVEVMERLLKHIEYMKYPPDHVDNHLVDFRYPHDLQIYLIVNRLPAMVGGILAKEYGNPVCYALHEGKPVRLVMASRMGDVGITSVLDAEVGYERRVRIGDLSNFTRHRTVILDAARDAAENKIESDANAG